VSSTKKLQPEVTEEMAAKQHARKAIIVAIVMTCITIFLLAEVLQSRLPDFVLEAAKTLAIAILTAIIIALLDHFYTIKEVTNNMAVLISREVTEKLDRLIQGREKYGLVGFLREMDFVNLFKQLVPEDELLWLDTYGPNYSTFLDELEDAIRRGAKIKMLVIDPMCPNATFRAEEIEMIGYREQAFRQQTEFFIQSITDASNRALNDQKTRGSCEIRMYRDLPCIPMYIIRRNGVLLKGYSSAYLTKPTSIRFVHLEWVSRKEDGVLEEMERYFNHKWNAQVQSIPPDGKPHTEVFFPKQ
jgi:hypothetical protein